MAGPWKDARGVIVTTTPTIEGQPVQQYLGIVTGEVIVGGDIIARLIKDRFEELIEFIPTPPAFAKEAAALLEGSKEANKDVKKVF